MYNRSPHGLRIPKTVIGENRIYIFVYILDFGAFHPEKLEKALRRISRALGDIRVRGR